MCLNFTKTVSSDLMSCVEKKLKNQDTSQFQCFKISFSVLEKQKSQVSFLNQVLEEQYPIERE